MQLRAEHSVFDDNKCNINVLIPPTRSDVLHPCDVMEVITAMVTILLSLEYSQFAFFLFANDKTSFYLFIFLKDVAIAYGYNDIPKRRLPSMKPLPLNQLEDLIRAEVPKGDLSLSFPLSLIFVLC
jgi:phenylalanyl-tRNA synthetase beta chain